MNWSNLISLRRARIAPPIVGAAAALVLVALPAAASAQEQLVDLALTKTDKPDPVQEAQELTYTLTVDSGDAPLGVGLQATVTDTLPNTVMFVRASEDCEHKPLAPGAPMGGTVTCSANLLLLPLMDPTEFEIVVLPAEAGTITNKAVLALAALGDLMLVDVNPDNNTAEAETTVEEAPEAITPNLAITKSDDPDPIERGKRLTYRLRVTNVENAEDGTDDATEVTITDTLPESVEFISASPGCSEADGTVTCEVGDLAEGDSAMREIDVRPTEAGRITNTAAVAAADDEPDPVPANNVARERTLVSAIPVRNCFGRTPTIFGTAGDDVIKGTQGPDVIDAGPGDDMVRGLRANDRICTRGGDDQIKGGNARDRINGGKGADVIGGNAGVDFLFGGRGNDQIRGGTRGDEIFGGPGADVLSGNQGNDLVRGGRGPDRVRGNTGNDRLFGNRGNDKLNGGTGTDTCRGGPGRDTVRDCEG